MLIKPINMRLTHHIHMSFRLGELLATDHHLGGPETANIEACSWERTRDSALIVCIRHEHLALVVHRIHTSLTCPECWVLFDELMAIREEQDRESVDIREEVEVTMDDGSTWTANLSRK